MQDDSSNSFLNSSHTIICKYKNNTLYNLFDETSPLENALLSHNDIIKIAFNVLYEDNEKTFDLEIDNYHLQGKVKKISNDTVAILYRYDEEIIKELEILREIITECVEINHHQFINAIKDLNRIAIKKLGVRTSSLWVYYASREHLECIDFATKEKEHSYIVGEILQYNFDDYYLQQLLENGYFHYDGDERSIKSQKLKDYINKHKIQYKYDIAIFYKDRLVAVLCFETTTKERFLSSFFLKYGKLLANNIELIFAIKFKDENEEKLQAIINNEHAGIIIYRDKVLYANQAISNMNGYSFEEMQKINTWDLFAPEIRPYFEDIIRRRMQGEHFPKAYNDAKVVTKSGEIRTVRISAETIVYEGRYAGISTIIDITDLIQTKEKLHILAQAVEQTDEIIRIVDRNGYIIYANQAMTKLTGYFQYELFGAKASILKSGKHSKAFYKRLWDTVLDKKIFREIIINKKKDGSLYHEDITISPILDEKGDIKYFVSTGKDVTRQIELQDKLQTLATTDTLTSIYNRYKMNEVIDFEIKNAKRYGVSFALIMFDIDYFKNINDSFGHDVGDDILRSLTALVQKNLRETDSFARWGGEEFLILLRKINTQEALQVANKLLTIIREYNFINDIKVTVSIGLAIYEKNSNLDKQTILKNADIALYKAKKGGRDQVVIYKG